MPFPRGTRAAAVRWPPTSRWRDNRSPASASAARAAREAPSVRRPAKAATRAVSFDDLVGTGEDRRRDRKPERLRGLEIDDQLESGWLLHRQVCRFGAMEDPSDINGG